MKSILLLIESFMGYDSQLIKTSKKYFNTTVIYYDKYWEDVQNRIHNNGILDFLTKVKFLKTFVINAVENKTLDSLNPPHNDDGYDYIFCINGDHLPNQYYEYLKILNPNAKFILYLYDDVSNISRHDHFKYFDYKYSYNLEDCKRYTCAYKAMFVQDIEEDLDYNQERIYDLAIIGTAHPDRLELVKKIYMEYKTKYNFFIYMYHPTQNGDFFWHRKPLSYSEYISVLGSSKVIIDIPYWKQTGPTLSLIHI